ncbi:MAG: hypothetical protein GW878_03780, partial [Acidobacteria bacterium]|nr:hypothetical protein [Acidobacteriota bacterium]
LLRFVPATAEVVMGIDCAALRGHPLIQDWLIEHQASWSGADDDLARFLADAGLDPLRDVDQVVVGVVPGRPRGQGLAVFAGHFDTAALAAAMQKRGGTVATIGTTVGYAFSSPPRVEILVALVSPTLVIAGDEATVRGTLAPNADHSQLADRETGAGRVDLGSDFWLVAVVPEEMRRHAAAVANDVSRGANEVRGLVLASGAIQRVTMQACLGTSLFLRGVAVADTGDNAELIRDAVKGALAAMRLEVGASSKELVDVLRDVDVTQRSTEVTVNAEVPVRLIETLLRERHTCSAGHTR